jgi:hypothetical protein
MLLPISQSHVFSIMYFVLSIMYKKFKFFLILILLIQTTCYILHATVAIVSAASLGLTVNPSTTIIQAISPTTVSRILSIQNKGDAKITLQIQLKSFKPKGESGELEYLKNASPILNSVQILDAGTPIDKIILNPEQQKNLELSINLPHNTNISDYYFSVIFISTDTSLVKSSSSINQIGIASNFLLSVGPKEVSKITLEQFSSAKLLEKGPIPFTVKIKNNGNHLLNPTGEIIIKNIFGQNVDKIELPKTNILYDSSRIVTPVWQKKFPIGFYTATINIHTSDKSPAISKTIPLFVFPFQELALIILIIVMLAITIKKLKQYSNGSSR